jgi:hypothetical protein
LVNASSVRFGHAQFLFEHHDACGVTLDGLDAGSPTEGRERRDECLQIT